MKNPPTKWIKLPGTWPIAMWVINGVNFYEVTPNNKPVTGGWLHDYVE